MAEIKKILYVHNSADRYGASRSLLRLMKGIDRSRFHPTVLLPEEGPLRDALEEEGVSVVVEEDLSIITRGEYQGKRGLLGFLWGVPRSAWKIRRIIKRRRVDIVHTNVGVIVSAGLAARLAGVKHVWHIRDWYQEFPKMWKYYERYIRWSGDKIIAVSKPIAKQFRVRKKVAVIHNGFELEEFDVDRERLRREFREKHGIDEGDFVVGCVGRIKLVRKGQEVVIQALGRLRQGGYNLKLLIIGEPFPGNEDHLETMKEMVAKKRMGEDVLFLGELSDVRPAYSAMDVFVLPSCQPEPFGGVVIEAMAMHLPVIATAIGGSLEQVEEGVTGYLVEPGDDVPIAGRLRELGLDGEKAIAMGEAGAKRVEKLFQFSDMLAKFEAVYEEILRDEDEKPEEVKLGPVNVE